MVEERDIQTVQQSWKELRHQEFISTVILFYNNNNIKVEYTGEQDVGEKEYWKYTCLKKSIEKVYMYKYILLVRRKN